VNTFSKDFLDSGLRRNDGGVVSSFRRRPESRRVTPSYWDVTSQLWSIAY